MSRIGLLVGLALVLVATAVGILLWTDMLSGNSGKTESQRSVTLPADPTPNRLSPEAQLMSEFQTIAAANGFVAAFSDQQTKHWELAAGNRFERLSLAKGSDIVIGRLYSEVQRDRPFVNWNELGLSTTLPLQFAQQSAGKEIEIGVIARSPSSNPSPSFSVIYATRQAGNSDWREFSLTPTFTVHKFVYTVPAVEGGYQLPPMLVIHADRAGSGKSVEMIGAYVKIKSP